MESFKPYEPTADDIKRAEDVKRTEEIKRAKENARYAVKGEEEFREGLLHFYSQKLESAKTEEGKEEWHSKLEALKADGSPTLKELNRRRDNTEAYLEELEAKIAAFETDPWYKRHPEAIETKANLVAMFAMHKEEAQKTWLR